MNILMVLAHPDDELIFGWPVVQGRCLIGTSIDDISLLILSNNRTKYGEGPENALRECCEATQVNLLDLPRLDTNFYRTPTRYNNFCLQDVVKLFYSNVEKAIDLVKPDFVFTHNPMGEYGHGDHRFVFDIVSLFSISLLLTDICFANRCHLSSDKIPDIYAKFLFGGQIYKHCFLNMNWYEGAKSIYERHKAWSWGGHDIVKECNLYQLL